jgi:hypothetical protein
MISGLDDEIFSNLELQTVNVTELTKEDYIVDFSLENYKELGQTLD